LIKKLAWEEEVNPDVYLEIHENLSNYLGEQGKLMYNVSSCHRRPKTNFYPFVF
jgi:hypothetical protein